MKNELLTEAQIRFNDLVLLARTKFFDETGMLVTNIKIESTDLSTFCGPDETKPILLITYKTNDNN